MVRAERETTGVRTILRSLLLLVGLSCLLVAAWTLLASGLFLSPARLGFAVVLPLVAGAAALVLSWLPPAAQLFALANGLAIVLAVYGAELYLERERTGRAQQDWTPWQAGAETPYPMLCGKYVMVMQPDGRVRSALRWGQDEVQPVGGIAMNPLGTGFTSDRHGFANPPGQWQTAATPLLAVGDSFAAGADVAPGQGFVDLLRARLGPIVNLGCSWNGPLLELASLVEYGPEVRPQTVLWFFYEGNDLTDLELERRSPLLRRYLEPGFAQGLSHRQETVDALLKSYVDHRLARNGENPGDATPLDYVVYGDPAERGRVDWTYVLTLQNLRWSQALLDYGRERETFALLGRILARADAVARGRGGRLVFVYLPGKARFTTGLGWTEAEAYRERVLAEVRARDLPLVDLTPDFAAHPRPGDLFAGHYSPAGNALVAEVVAAAIRQETARHPRLSRRARPASAPAARWRGRGRPRAGPPSAP
jgi:hypothetical protein